MSLLAGRLFGELDALGPLDLRRRERGPREEVALTVPRTGSDHGLELRLRLDAFRDDPAVELAAQAHDRGDELEQTRVLREPRDEIAIELHDARMEVGDVLE